MSRKTNRLKSRMETILQQYAKREANLRMREASARLAEAANRAEAERLRKHAALTILVDRETGDHDLYAASVRFYPRDFRSGRFAQRGSINVNRMAENVANELAEMVRRAIVDFVAEGKVQDASR